VRAARPVLRDRTILDLCSGTGAWSEPYARAGYRVVRVDLPKLDMRTWKPPKRVWGVLAAPPCDQFSLARNGSKAGPRRILDALAVVHACLAIVALTSPEWWALENPVGLLSTYLGTPKDVWHPHEFGDPWTKRTAIWGDYNVPERGPHVRPRAGGGPLCPCNGKRRVCWRAAHRAVTPPGFARAFFEANP
jgi:site-specific DNA-cytosine methylase